MGFDLVFPKDPDWGWLRSQYGGSGLLWCDCAIVDVAAAVAGRLAYLATPYSKVVLNDDFQWDRRLSSEAEDRAAHWALAFAVEGATVVSPILQSCAMVRSDVTGLLDPMDPAFWNAWCQPMLASCGSVVIAPIDGWCRSLGIWRETCWALRHNVPVYLLGANEVAA